MLRSGGGSGSGGEGAPAHGDASSQDGAALSVDPLLSSVFGRKDAPSSIGSVTVTVVCGQAKRFEKGTGTTCWLACASSAARTACPPRSIADSMLTLVRTRMPCHAYVLVPTHISLFLLVNTAARCTVTVGKATKQTAFRKHPTFRSKVPCCAAATSIDWQVLIPASPFLPHYRAARRRP
jgi:hypothetical protein